MSTVELDELTRAWPPISGAVRVPHTEREYRDLVDVLDQLIDIVGQDERHPLASLMDVLGVLIEKYEDENVPELQP
jgi:HTH-type transcriptional regulator/antitoxin HigA